MISHESELTQGRQNKADRKRKRQSRGQAKHRRIVLAEERRVAIPDIDHKILERSQATRRLADVERQLDPQKNPNLSSLGPYLKAILEIEGLLLLQRVGKITPEQRRTKMSGMLDTWQAQSPEVYQWMLSVEDHGTKSHLVLITEKVFPPPQQVRDKPK